MRAFKKFGKRGFTLVELMIVVAIIGVLAALAIYGINRYLASSKTSEAKNGVGAITRGAVSAYEKESNDSEMLPEGSTSTTASHTLCGSATPVPNAAIPAGRKYQPVSTQGADYQTGTATAGWSCVRFEMKEPHYYQYHYWDGQSLPGSANPAACTTPGTCFTAGAAGDLDGDGATSLFERTGVINPTTQSLRTATQVYIQDELE